MSSDFIEARSGVRARVEETPVVIVLRHTVPVPISVWMQRFIKLTLVIVEATRGDGRSGVRRRTF